MLFSAPGQSTHQSLHLRSFDFRGNDQQWKRESRPYLGHKGGEKPLQRKELAYTGGVWLPFSVSGPQSLLAQLTVQRGAEEGEAGSQGESEINMGAWSPGRAGRGLRGQRVRDEAVRGRWGAHSLLLRVKQGPPESGKGTPGTVLWEKPLSQVRAGGGPD